MSEKKDICRTGRPTREDAAALSDHLVATAGELFLRHGYAAVSINAIASAAKIAKHTIYRRFADKSALFAEVIRRRTDAIQHAFDEAAAISGDPLVGLRVLGEQLARMALDQEWIALYRMTIAEASRFPELTPILLAHTGDRLVAVAAELVAQAQAAGRFAQGDSMFLAQHFMYMMAGRLLQNALAGKSEFDDPEALTGYLDASWELFLAAVRPAG